MTTERNGSQIDKKFTALHREFPAMITRLARNSILFSTCAACWLFLTCAASTAEPDAAEKRASVEARLKKLDPLFKQHVVVGGTMVASSEKVSRWALEEVAYLMRHMLANRPDVLNGYTRLLTVLAYTEMQSALPACRSMNAWWDYRARGLAGSTISCGEENVLCLKGDPWAGENIFVHEFGHGLNRAFGGMDKEFQCDSMRCTPKPRKAGCSADTVSRILASAGPRAFRRGSIATGRPDQNRAVGKVPSKGSDPRAST